MVAKNRPLRRGAIAAVALACGVLAASACATDLASESPQQILSASAAAIRGAKGYEMRADMHVHPGGTESVDLISAGGSNYSAKIAVNQGQARFIHVGGKAYLKASVRFWETDGVTSSLAETLAHNWYLFPSKDFAGLTADLQPFEPASFARCFVQDESPVSKLGTASVNGQQAVILKQPGGKPGLGPETLAIAATGKPYPLRITETGPTPAGGPKGCGSDGKADDTTGTVTMSDWGSPPPVTAPANAIKLPSS